MSSLYVKHEENKRIHYLIPLENKFDGRVAYLDLTDKIRNAINKDRRNRYGEENGPNFGIEILHAREYAKYVNEHAHVANLHKFNTRSGYSFFISSLTDDQIKREEKRRSSEK